jgi:lipopolysaccharide export system protein LptA
MKHAVFGALAFAAIAGLAGASAQETADLFKGFGSSSKEPIHVDAAKLEIVEEGTQRISTFSGGVIMRRGDTVLNAGTVKLYEPVSPAKRDEDDKTGGKDVEAKKAKTSEEKAQKAISQAAAGTPAKGSGFSKVEAIGSVKVRSGPQVVTGDRGVFDPKANTIVVTGKVVLTQGANVINGTRLVVDMTTGKATVDQSGGRIKGVFTPSDSTLTGKKPAEKAEKKKDKPVTATP